MLSFPFPIIIVTSSSTTITIFTNHHFILLLLWHYKHYCQHLSNNVLCVYVQNDIKIKRGSLLIWLSTTKTIATHIIFTWGENENTTDFVSYVHSTTNIKRNIIQMYRRNLLRKPLLLKTFIIVVTAYFHLLNYIFYHKKINYEETNTKKLSERERRGEQKGNFNVLSFGALNKW